MNTKQLFIGLLFIVGLLAACTSPVDKSTNSSAIVSNDQPVLDNWQDVSSDYVNFRVPETWQPTAVSPGMGSTLVEWHLGIPGVGNDQSIAFFSMPFSELKPNDVVAEYEILIGDMPGMKWVRRGQDYTSYDYYTAGTAAAQAAGAGSFGLHVTVPTDDPDLEPVLDIVAASILFNQ